MFEKAPGFAPAWQITLKEAESRFEKSERGVVPLLKRLMPTTPDKQAEEYEKSADSASPTLSTNSGIAIQGPPVLCSFVADVRVRHHNQPYPSGDSW